MTLQQVVTYNCVFKKVSTATSITYVYMEVAYYFPCKTITAYVIIMFDCR